MKILLCNFAYGSWVDGKYHNYFLKTWRKKKHETHSLSKLRNIILRENPDIICICEIKRSHIHSHLVKDLPYKILARSKYADSSIIGKYIFGRHRFNAVFSKEAYASEKIFLETGIKKLLYKIHLQNNIFLYFWHFSLFQKSRKRQFQELWSYIDSQEKNIICGDFNIFSWIQELSPLIDKADLRVVSADPSFPAYKPQKTFDLFLAGNSLDMTSYLLPDIFSDHLALIADLKIE